MKTQRAADIAVGCFVALFGIFINSIVGLAQQLQGMLYLNSVSRLS